MNQEKLQKTQARFVELEKLLADPEIINDQKQYQKLAKEYSDLIPVAAVVNEYFDVLQQKEDLQIFLKEGQDKDFVELAQAELEDLDQKIDDLTAQLEDLFHPQKQHEDRDLIFEIRAGTGGQEASLFAADLYRMYTKYADKKGWIVESISSHESETGGFKEVIFSICGAGAAKHLQWESGAHRVQRVPATEAAGRIHTSAATVAVLFEPEEIDVEIDPADVKTDVFRASGPGGQSVNTTDSAIRLTHLPSGLVVICQDERSQLKNKHKAMRVLRARLADKIQQENDDIASQERKLKVGTGDRSDKIRTYNFPDRRITDHRIGFTTYRLMSVMEGELDELTEALIKADQEEFMSTENS